MITTISTTNRRFIHGQRVSLQVPLIIYLTTVFQVLDPRISYEGACEDYANDADLLEYLKSAKSSLRAHYEKSYASHSHSLNLSTSSLTNSANDDDINESPSKVNFTSRYKKKDSISRDELEEYFKLPREDFDTCRPLEWWVGRQAQFPNLYCLARDLLTIPGKSFSGLLSDVNSLRSSQGSAVAVERIFSGGRDTISLRRASLQPGTIRTLMSLKQRLRLARLPAP